MPFDQPTRNRLARFVGDARTLLSEEFTRQLQHEYGLDPASGDVTDLDKLSHLDDARRETARILRETLNHYLAGVTKPSKKGQQEALQRIVREQAYTVLNRLAALRMAETRGQVIECVARGHQSRGFDSPFATATRSLRQSRFLKFVPAAARSISPVTNIPTGA